MFLFCVCELSTFLRPIRLAKCSPQRACTAARAGDRTYSVPMTLADITTWAAMPRSPRIAKTRSETGRHHGYLLRPRSHHTLQANRSREMPFACRLTRHVCCPDTEVDSRSRFEVLRKFQGIVDFPQVPAP